MHRLVNCLSFWITSVRLLVFLLLMLLLRWAELTAGADCSLQLWSASSDWSAADEILHHFRFGLLQLSHWTLTAAAAAAAPAALLRHRATAPSITTSIVAAAVAVAVMTAVAVKVDRRRADGYLDYIEARLYRSSDCSRRCYSWCRTANPNEHIVVGWIRQQQQQQQR